MGEGMKGKAAMIDVNLKQATERCALASCRIRMKPETFRLLRGGFAQKGDVFTVAKVAGILAAKKTHELIPLCHPLPLGFVDIRFSDLPDGDGFWVESEVRTTAKTGVEMEALTGAAVAALTIYDMAKMYDQRMTVEELHLIRKTGGKSDFFNPSGNHHRE